MSSVSAQPQHELGMSARERARRYDVLLVFLGLWLVNSLLMPGMMLPSDPHGWFSEARMLVDTGSLAVPQEIADALPPGLFIENPVDGKLYSKYGVASSLTVVVPIWVAKMFGAVGRSELVIVNLWQAATTGAVGALLYLVAGLYTSRRWLQVAFVLACFYCTFMWFYLRAQGTEIYQCLFFTAWFYAAVRLWRGLDMAARSRGRLTTLMWICCLLLIHTRPFYLLMVPATCLLLAGVRAGHPRGVAKLISAGAKTLVPAALLLFSWMAVNRLKFGYWTATGYHVMGNGGESASWRNLPQILRFVMDPGLSVFTTFPVLTIAAFGIGRMSVSQRKEWLIAVAHVIVFAFIPAAYGIVDGGWSEGPRYLLFVLPVLCLPIIGLVESLASGAAGKRAWLVIMLAVLLISSFSWWNVISRPMFAWHRIVYTAGPVMDVVTAQRMIAGQHGMVLRQFDVPPEGLDSLALMQRVRAAAPEEFYTAYRREVWNWTRPRNFIWYTQPSQAQ